MKYRRTPNFNKFNHWTHWIHRIFKNTKYAKLHKTTQNTRTQNTQNFTKQHKILRCHFSKKAPNGADCRYYPVWAKPKALPRQDYYGNQRSFRTCFEKWLLSFLCILCSVLSVWTKVKSINGYVVIPSFLRRCCHRRHAVIIGTLLIPTLWLLAASAWYLERHGWCHRLRRLCAPSSCRAVPTADVRPAR